MFAAAIVALPGLSAALGIFTERGYAGTRLDDVAERAGVSKGTLYLYFATVLSTESSMSSRAL